MTDLSPQFEQLQKLARLVVAPQLELFHNQAQLAFAPQLEQLQRQTQLAFTPQFEQLQRQMRLALPQFERFQKQMRLAFAPQLENLMKQIAKSFDVRRFIAPDVLERLRASLARELPPNWPKDRNIETMVSLVHTTGWPLIWVPEVAMIEKLMKSLDQSRRERALLRHRSKILDECRRRLDQVKTKELRYLAQCGIEAVDVLEAGHSRASQALAASVLTTVLQVKLGFRKLKDARSQLDELSWEKASLPWFRWTLITSTVVGALTDFYVHQGDPVPRSFNRHATVHHLNPKQLTRVNALVSVMMVASLLRELEQLIRNGRVTLPKRPTSQRARGSSVASQSRR